MTGSIGQPPGTLVVSFDTELIWGSFDHTSPEAFERRFPDERGTIDQLLHLLDRYEVPATWAVLGHLFLGACERDAAGRAHPELVHPLQRWYGGDWLRADPCSDRRRAPLWYGDDVLDAIQGARTTQEIGSHSFSHPLFDDPDLTREAVASDLGACRRLAQSRGIELRSFVFPRNREAHHDVLRDAGFIAFRGADPTWYAALPGATQRPAHLVDQALGIAPPATRPSRHPTGLWNIPGSMMLLHRSGIRRWVPLSSRVRKARRGLARAAATGAVFHLWTHPFNVANDRPALLRVFEAALHEAARLRDAGQLTIEPMGDLARRLQSGLGPSDGSAQAP